MKNAGFTRTYYVEYEEAAGKIRYLEKVNAEKDRRIARLQHLYEMERKEKESAHAKINEQKQTIDEYEARIGEYEAQIDAACAI